MTSVRKRSVTISGHRTSISLEQEFWDALKEIASEHRLSISQLVEKVDQQRSQTADVNLSSHLRLFALDHFRRAARESMAPSPPYTGDSD